MLTADLTRAYENLSTYTSSESHARHQTQIKRQLSSAIREGSHLPVDHLRRYESVYMCAHTDLAYPLLLGCRNIRLVDRIFVKGVDRVVEVLEKAERICGKTIVPELSGEIRFDFDFGAGPEMVSVRCTAAEFQTNDDEDDDGPLLGLGLESILELLLGLSVREAKEPTVPFTPEAEIGLLLGHCTAYVELDDDPAVLGAVVQGGHLLTNRPAACLDIKRVSEVLNELKSLYEDDPMRALEELYRNEGKYSFIRLEGIDEPYTFLQKVA